MIPKIRIAETEKDIAACMALRWTVFVEEQGVPPEDELDGTDDGCTHVIATHGQTVVGAARFQVTGDTVKIGRVCVPCDCRGRGIGAKIIEFACASVTATRAILGAQTGAIPFYERLDFQTFGDPYMDAGIPHQDMERRL